MGSNPVQAWVFSKWENDVESQLTRLTLFSTALHTLPLIVHTALLYSTASSLDISRLFPVNVSGGCRFSVLEQKLLLCFSALDKTPLLISGRCLTFPLAHLISVLSQILGQVVRPYKYLSLKTNIVKIHRAVWKIEPIEIMPILSSIVKSSLGQPGSILRPQHLQANSLPLYYDCWWLIGPISCK